MPNFFSVTTWICFLCCPNFSGCKNDQWNHATSVRVLFFTDLPSERDWIQDGEFWWVLNTFFSQCTPVDWSIVCLIVVRSIDWLIDQLIDWLILCCFQGELLRGDRVVSTPYDLRMGTDEPCKILCKNTEKADQLSVLLSAEDGKTIGERVREAYYVHLWVTWPFPISLANRLDIFSIPSFFLTVLL